MKYLVHIGIGIENAKKHSSICEFNHEFLSELVGLIENQPEVNMMVSEFNEKEKYIELKGDFDDLGRFKNNLSDLKVKKSIESDFECLIFACEKAHKNKMHLYIIME